MKITRADRQHPDLRTSLLHPKSVNDHHQDFNRRSTTFILLAGFGLIFLFMTSGGSAQAPEWIQASINLNELPVHHQPGSVTEQTNKLEAPLPATPPLVEEANSNWFMDGLRSLLSPNTSSSPAVINDGWVPILSDDFEGTFPGVWTVFDNNGSNYGTYHWNKRNCHAYEGSYSAWAVGGGADGDGLSCGSAYPDYAWSWMIYGPFSLEDATAAEVNFKYWLNSESGYDKFWIVASIDGTGFSGLYTSGNSNVWSEYTFDLTDVGSLGDLSGESQVWIGFIFQSDGSVNYAEGAYVDNVLLRKYVQDIPTDTPTSTPTGSVTPTSTPTRTATPTSTPTLTPTPPIGPLPMVNYIPVVINRYPIKPTEPVLNAISNDDGDGSYTVSWSPVFGAFTYLLQEDDNSSFSSPTTAYEGSATSKSITGKPVGTYYYRVRAINDYATSGWSNVRSVVVSVAQPPCPQTGHWTGLTNQSRAISFDVEDSPRCQVAAGSLKITVYAYPCGVTTTTFMQSYPILNYSFVTGPIDDQTHWVKGTFSSSTTVEGTFNFYIFNPYEPWNPCDYFGSWSASP